MTVFENCAFTVCQTVQQERENVCIENRSLVTRLSALTDILTTQEQYITQVGFNSSLYHAVSHWCNGIYHTH